MPCSYFCDSCEFLRPALFVQVLFASHGFSGHKEAQNSQEEQRNQPRIEHCHQPDRPPEGPAKRLRMDGVIEESNHGWFALQPTHSGNHHFPIATLPTNVGDLVHLWGCDASSPPQRIMVSPSKVMLLDLRMTSWPRNRTSFASREMNCYLYGLLQPTEQSHYSKKSKRFKST